MEKQGSLVQLEFVQLLDPSLTIEEVLGRIQKYRAEIGAQVEATPSRSHRILLK